MSNTVDVSIWNEKLSHFRKILNHIVVKASSIRSLKKYSKQCRFSASIGLEKIRPSIEIVREKKIHADCVLQFSILYGRLKR